MLQNALNSSAFIIIAWLNPETIYYTVSLIKTMV